jgi:hypothetical protein
MKSLAAVAIMVFGAMAALAGTFGMTIIPASIIPVDNPGSTQLTILVGIILVAAGYGFYRGKFH